jgi:hypothetical protein
MRDDGDVAAEDATAETGAEAGRAEQAAEAPGEPAQGPEEQPVKRQNPRSVRGIVLSLGVVLLAAFWIYVFVPHDENIDPVKPVSYRVELDSARRAAPYPVAAPVGLPDGWRATSVRYDASGEEGRVWHLGFVTPDTQYAAVEQSDAKRPARFVASVTQQARKTAKTVEVRGETWTRYEGEKYDALVRESKGHTTVVTGTASAGQLERMATALRAK